MKCFLLSSLCVFALQSFSQNIQLVYDLRHTADPGNNPKNFPTLYFEYFKSQDSGKSFIKPGSFLFKMEADAFGPGMNTCKIYFQVSQTLRFWVSKVFLHLSVSSGLGVTEPKQYSYYILNTYLAGVALPFQWKGGFYSLVLDYKYVPYKIPSSDFLSTFYYYRGFFNYRFEFLGDFSCWTENKNHGDTLTVNMIGKQFFFYGEPQLWYRLAGGCSVGGRMNIYYHVYTNENKWQVYPAIGIRWKL
ncbi:MAG TPA: DUF5020 family protein [Puia sp.]|jgi:hypothetical protein|nr:DUF5020 family protein [Puia sp.]